MFQLQKLLVALDRSEIDEQVVRYVFAAAGLVRAEEIVFMHVIPSPKDRKPDAPEPVSAEEAEAYLKRLADAHRPENLSATVRLFVAEGDILNTLVKKSREDQSDMVVVGRRHAGNGTGTTARMLARKAPCSVIYVPQNSKPDFSKTLLPIDFSEFSKMSMERCINIARKHPMEIIALNIYTLPKGYTSSGKSKEEFAAIMEKNARKRYEHFMKQFETRGLPITPRFVLDTRKAFAKIIFNYALIEEAKVIIIGSRGKDNVAAKLLGSTTEQLLMQNAVIPTIVMKNKGHNTSFFKALFNI